MVGKQDLFKVGEEVFLDLCFNAELSASHIGADWIL